ncbi:MAG: tRNA lysidine(34) synthetase TilS [Caldisericia bacterium]|nr:tRNA lysidine(34) synthetase TilS [Caldisericia bacterium]
MNKLLQNFVATFRQEKFSQPLNFLLAVSGGADSMVMLYAFQKTMALLKTNIFVTHINYHLRQEDSNKDEFLVTDYCSKNKIPFEVVQITASAWNNTPGTGMEEKARFLRYQAFNKLRNENNCCAIAVGHNLDDLCETFCFNLIRGSSPEKLASVMPVLDNYTHIFRPLLSFDRNAIRVFAHDMNIPFNEDKTNLDVAYSRNRIRSNIIPEAQIINPKFADSISRFRDILATENNFLEQEVTKVLCSCKIIDSVCISRSTLVSFHIALQRRVIVACRKHVTGNRIDFSFASVEMIRKTILSQQIKNGILYSDHSMNVVYKKPDVLFVKKEKSNHEKIEA